MQECSPNPESMSVLCFQIESSLNWRDLVILFPSEVVASTCKIK